MTDHRAEEGRPGTDRRLLQLQHTTAAADILLQLARQCRYRLDIYSPDFEPALYSRQEFVGACKNLVLSSPRSRIRILLKDNRRAQQEGHRMLPLLTRLTSSIEVRSPPDQQELPLEAMLLADSTAYCLRRVGKMHDYEACLHAPLAGRQFQEQFNELWEQSIPDSQLRRLQL